jgi:hypothetical protein
MESAITKFLLLSTLSIEVVIKFNVAYIYRGRTYSYLGSIIADRNLINKRYLKTELLFDASAAILLAVYYYVFDHNSLSADAISLLLLYFLFFKKISSIQKKI